MGFVTNKVAWLTAILLSAQTFAMDFSLKHAAIQQQVSSLGLKKQDLLSTDSLTTQYDKNRIVPISIEGDIPAGGTIKTSLAKMTAVQQNQTRCFLYLDKIKTALRIKNPRSEFLIVDQQANNFLSAHFKVRQIYRGIPVYGSEATVHMIGNKAVYLGRSVPTPAIGTILPQINAPAAARLIKADLVANGVALQEFTADEKAFFGQDTLETKLAIYPGDSSRTDRLVWQMSIRPNFIDWWEYIVDAMNGNILYKFNKTCDAGDITSSAKDLLDSTRTIHTYQSDKYYLVDASRTMFNAAKSSIPKTLTGAIVTYDYQNKYPAKSSFVQITSTKNIWDKKAVSAQYNASVAYEYYRTTHNRNSIDGKGGSIISFINVADQNGNSFDNAYWNGKGMFYGNGNKTFLPLAAALDVAGHEMTHGVVQATAALQYAMQPGALNESLADIFGCMIERKNWTMGESIVKPGVFPSGALRNISNPHNGAATGKSGWQPLSMAEYRNLANTTAGDNGGVHVNSGIPSRAYYLFANSTGKDIAEKVYYRALTTYLTASAKFVDMRIAAIKACQELYGKGSAENVALAAAFDTVQIYGDSVTPVKSDLPVNPGKEYVLLTAAPVASDGTTLYIADNNFANLKSVSKRTVKFRPSVSDDGKKALFVSGDKRLISLSLDASPVQEKVVDSSQIWAVCAISRDGKKFAAVKEVKDTSIYIGSMTGGQMHRFDLTGSSDDSSTANVAGIGAVYSSAMEWSYDGENVLYDVYNTLLGDNGVNIQYWDIGSLRVWNEADNGYGDGTVSKLFSYLPDGISVGNPTFSKNSPDVIAYDYVDNVLHTVSVYTTNLVTRKSTVVASSSFTGYPCYSKLDDKLAFSSTNGTDTVISVVALKSDKQTPAGNATVGIRRMKWPVYFGAGVRNTTGSTLQKTADIPLSISIVSGNHGCRIFFDNTIHGENAELTITSVDGKMVEKQTLCLTGTTSNYIWDGRNRTGSRVATGIYIARILTRKTAFAKAITVSW